MRVANSLAKTWFHTSSKLEARYRGKAALLEAARGLAEVARQLELRTR